MSSPVPISTDEISQYQIETALDNFSNLKTKVGEAVRAFLASVKFDTAKITNETLTRFLETHLENLNILFTEELFSDPEFFKKLTSSESSDKQPSSTTTPDVDTLSNAIIKEILPSIYENNIQLSTSAAQSSSKPAVQTSNITESNSSTQIPSKNVTAISPQTSITSIHRISYVSQMRTESSVLLGALAITLDKLQGITTTISRQAVVSTTVATAAPLMLSKKTPSIFKPKHKGLKLKNVFSKASILKVISPIGKMFTFLIKGSLKLLVGTVKLIGKSIVCVSKLIFNLAKTIINFGKQVFKKIGQGLAGLFKLVKKAFVFSAKRIGKIFKAVFIDSKIASVVLPYALGFIYGYIKTKFFSEGTFIDGLKKMLDSIKLPSLKFGKKEKDKDADEKDDDSSFIDFVGDSVKSTALAIYNKINSPLTKEEVIAVQNLVTKANDAIQASSPVPVPIQIGLHILDAIFEKLGINLNLQENAIHITNVMGLLIKGKTEYDKTLAKAEEKRKTQFKEINDSIETFGNEHIGEGKLDILHETVIQPLITTITERVTKLGTNLATVIQEKFKAISDTIKDFNLDDIYALMEPIKDVAEDIIKGSITIVETLAGSAGAKVGGFVGGAALTILKWVNPVGIITTTVISILMPLLGQVFAKSAVGNFLRAEVGAIDKNKKSILDVETEHGKYSDEMLKVIMPKKAYAATLDENNEIKYVSSGDSSSSDSSSITQSVTGPLKNSGDNAKTQTAATPTTDVAADTVNGSSNKEKSDSPPKSESIIEKNVSTILKAITDLADKDANINSTTTLLTPFNIATILSDKYDGKEAKLETKDLSEEKWASNAAAKWIDISLFKFIRAAIFNKYIAKHFANKTSLTDNDIFKIKYIFLKLSNPFDNIYKTVFDIKMTPTGFVNFYNLLTPSKYKDRFYSTKYKTVNKHAPSLGDNWFSEHYLDEILISGNMSLANDRDTKAYTTPIPFDIPINLLFHKTNESSKTNRLHNFIKSDNSVAGIVGGAESDSFHHTVDTMLNSDLNSKQKIRGKSLEEHYLSLFPNEQELIAKWAENEQKANDTIKTTEKTRKTLEQANKDAIEKPKAESASVTAVGVVNTPDAPVTNDSSKTTNFGETN